MTKKQRDAHRFAGLSALLKRHSYWKGSDDERAHLLNKLAIHYRVNTGGFPYPALGEIRGGPSKSELLDLLLAVAAELYPAFERPPSKGGRPNRYVSGLFEDYPDAHAARLVQLFASVKKQKKQRDESATIPEICRALVRIYGGKYPNWHFNNLRTPTSLRRRGWDVISSEIKAHPERFLPADGREPLWMDGRPYLPPLPGGTKSRQ